MINIPFCGDLEVLLERVPTRLWGGWQVCPASTPGFCICKMGCGGGKDETWRELGLSLLTRRDQVGWVLQENFVNSKALGPQKGASSSPERFCSLGAHFQGKKSPLPRPSKGGPGDGLKGAGPGTLPQGTGCCFVTFLCSFLILLYPKVKIKIQLMDRSMNWDFRGWTCVLKHVMHVCGIPLGPDLDQGFQSSPSHLANTTCFADVVVHSLKKNLWRISQMLF